MDKTYEIIRRWHCGHSLSDIALKLGHDRKTIRKTIQRAKCVGICLSGKLPEYPDFLSLYKENGNERPGRNGVADILLPYIDEILELVNNIKRPLKPKFAFEVICQRYGLTQKISYSSFKRFYRKHCVKSGRSVTCRIESEPGELVQIDYAKMGTLFDPETGRNRVIFAFIGSLGYSRHKFVEFTFKQDQQNFVASHVRMFDFFGGIPGRIVFDNLKAGVIKPDLYDPELNHTYREMAEFYGCFLDPCRVASPKDKGKVERDVQTIRQQFYKFLALNAGLDCTGLNIRIREWLRLEYGTRPHGTTGYPPFQLYQEAEKPVMKPLPLETFEIATWKKAKVHPDNYVQFGKKFFSVPYSFSGKIVWLKATATLLTIYDTERNVIKKHLITSQTRHTDWYDFPENIRIVLDSNAHQRLISRAGRIGPFFTKLIKGLLKNHAFVNFRKVQGLIRLNEKFTSIQLEAAAKYVLTHTIDVKYHDFKRLLEQTTAIEKPATDTAPVIGEKTRSFIRPADYFRNP